MTQPSTSTTASSSSTAPPSPTLYVKNIESKVKKSELRRQLHTLFSTYGRVLDIVATRAPSMRGQAFVVFETPIASTAAKRALEGFSFYGKPLRVDYSTGAKSRALVKREVGREALMEADLERARTVVGRGEKRTVEDAHTEEEEEEEGRKRVKLEEAVVEAKGVPNNIEAEVLETLFSRHTGFLHLTTTKDEGETWNASIAFDTTDNAEAARDALKDVQIDPLYKLDLHLL